jgi:hypothetical protein
MRHQSAARFKLTGQPEIMFFFGFPILFPGRLCQIGGQRWGGERYWLEG